MVELSAIWVVVIVVIGIAVGLYSVCKGCQGMREQAAQANALRNDRLAGRTLMHSPYAGIVQQLRANNVNQTHLFLISGRSIQDKNPPSYEDIIEPPPSYEETVKYIYDPSLARYILDEREAGAHVNLALDVSDEQQGASGSSAMSPTPPQPPPPPSAHTVPPHHSQFTTSESVLESSPVTETTSAATSTATTSSGVDQLRIVVHS